MSTDYSAKGFKNTEWPGAAANAAGDVTSSSGSHVGGPSPSNLDKTTSIGPSIIGGSNASAASAAPTHKGTLPQDFTPWLMKTMAGRVADKLLKLGAPIPEGTIVMIHKGKDELYRLQLKFKDSAIAKKFLDQFDSRVSVKNATFKRIFGDTVNYINSDKNIIQLRASFTSDALGVVGAIVPDIYNQSREAAETKFNKPSVVAKTVVSKMNGSIGNDVPPPGLIKAPGSPGIMASIKKFLGNKSENSTSKVGKNVVSDSKKSTETVEKKAKSGSDGSINKVFDLSADAAGAAAPKPGAAADAAAAEAKEQTDRINVKPSDHIFSVGAAASATATPMTDTEKLDELYKSDSNKWPDPNKGYSDSRGFEFSPDDGTFSAEEFKHEIDIMNNNFSRLVFYIETKEDITRDFNRVLDRAKDRLNKAGDTSIKDWGVKDVINRYVTKQGKDIGEIKISVQDLFRFLNKLEPKDLSLPNASNNSNTTETKVAASKSPMHDLFESIHGDPSTSVPHSTNTSSSDEKQVKKDGGNNNYTGGSQDENVVL